MNVEEVGKRLLDEVQEEPLSEVCSPIRNWKIIVLIDFKHFRTINPYSLLFANLVGLKQSF